MYCPKCGHQITDDSIYCRNCGEKISNTEERIYSQKKATSKDAVKSKLFAAHILNIIAFVIPLALLYGMTHISSNSEDYEPATGDVNVTVEVEGNFNGRGLFIAMMAGLVIFIIGLVIYFAKSPSLRKKLSYVYLIGAIAALMVLFFSMMMYVMSTCGIGSVIFIPGILQIVAGYKFVMGTRSYE